MKFRALAIGATALILPFAAACSDDDGNSTSEASISSQLQEGGALDKEQADCAAKLFKENISEKGLQTLVDSEAASIDDIDLSEEDQKAFSDTMGQVTTECMGIEMPEDVELPETEGTDGTDGTEDSSSGN